MRTATPGTLRELLQVRGITMEALAVLADRDLATVSRIVNGLQRPRPETVVQLARALGIGAKRMQGMCEAAWAAAHQDGART